ncbi:chromosome segregation protein SMC [Bifidobacterium panos]|uniref:Chromosome partition protein Smc n=1 Tax=Bifidobacterium panos TaxID=2675321 RepID=A0ABX1SVR3_9BIFI|nr:chromosome segregation protein SMC [Bifidobacterium sp. DSM 109963]NMN01435.1 chromosome segregation protein SMC [Bifidobacterium sp. DSM 109963]
MYLKELTLRGFKSFASATTLRFEPGITAVVGPNGSGKSNIVDALTWVMGEQGAKNLRGTSMEDVIFAGTSSRPPLGRAQVSLTIDNSDHTLNIDYTEVTISRTIFRNGGSEYAINGSACRLLDIQELLSDTGLGQQMHVIVGQGRLDAILRADPSGHRAFIEEAAGILKHRKRKERALRKLANTEANLSRLDDLLGEIHRQLGPLGRQARISRRAQSIQVSLRDAQSRLYAEDALKAMERRSLVRGELTEVRGALNEAQRELAQVKVRIEQVEALSHQSSPAIEQVNQTWHSLSQIQERLSSLGSIAEERARSLSGQIVTNMGEDAGILHKRADELEEQAKVQAGAVNDARLALDKATEERADNEKQLASVRQTLTELRKTAQERDARIAKLRELIAREESAVQLAETRAKDFTSQREGLRKQCVEAESQCEQLEAETEEAGNQDDSALEQAQAELAECREALNEALDRQREAQSKIISLQAKADALSDTLESRNASGSLEVDEAVGALGRLTDFIHVAEGWEEAVAHALDQFASAIIVPEAGNMLHALERAKNDKLGKAVVITAQAGAVSRETDRGWSPASDLVTANPDAADAAQAEAIVNAVRALLADVAAVDTPEEAQKLVERGSSAQRAVTRDGEVFVAGVAAVGGSSLSQSDLSLAARRDKALKQVKELSVQADDLAAKVEQATAARDEASRTLDAETTKRTEVKLKAEQAAKSLRSAKDRVANFQRQITQLEEKIAKAGEEAQSHRTKLDDLQASLSAAQNAENGQVDAEELVKREQALEAALGMARDQETATKIAWTEASRKTESLTRQASLLRANAKEATERRARIEALNEKRSAQAEHMQGVAADAREVASLVERAIGEVISKREELQEAASSHDEELKALRTQRNGIEPKVTDLTGREHALDVNRERLATEYGQLTQKVSDELGLTLEELVEQYGPDQPVPVLDDSGNPVPVDGGESEGDKSGNDKSDGQYQTVAYNRSEQQKRLDKARRDLAALGKVNPLAMEEYDALEERNKYLNDQRADVAKSRDDLMQLIKDLDSTMVEVFKSAFDDTAEAFEKMFATLFPGGKGRLRLESPDNLLTSGVLVEASPAGKRVKQLSLLSGGERSLTALALLFAIFTARPSPFYVMDEVEAALDDVNLTRLINAFNQLRERAQLIIITHQQRTMSIADALYGVTMRADGVTAVVSQKLEH